MAVYTITLLELSSTMSSGTIIERQNIIKDWIFNCDVGLDNELYEKFKEIFIKKYLFAEIGYETPALFRNRLLTDLYSKADYYNQLWRLYKILMNWDFMEDDINVVTQDNEKTNTSAKEEMNRNNTTRDLYTGSQNLMQTEQNTEQRTSDGNTDSESSGEDNINSNVVHENNGQIVDIKHGEKLNQGEGNNASADFPQTMNIPNKDYWTQGGKENQQTYDALDETNTRTLSDGYDETNTAHNNRTEAGNVKTKNTDNAQTDRDLGEENIEQTSRKITDELEDILNKIIEGNKDVNSIRRGRIQRRQIPEIIRMIIDQYVSVPEKMCIDMGTHFMTIW